MFRTLLAHSESVQVLLHSTFHPPDSPMGLSRQHFRKPLRLMSLRSSMPLSSSAAFRTPAIEDEQSPGYDPGKYYPAWIGEAIGKYRIISKLGWGTSSTAWLAKDVSRSVASFHLRNIH